ncbi:MAG: anaerobic ribonucleoside-triphosphate reductase activating protein [Acutalibacteraceae bacterium]|nr:anaerobic ribonucleoside-triphosphate reductase activating protein [Acutalibacteraceae bacterium]HCA55414.1 anaerobic ribonucleoside-triphosphate reductase activating protein [Oscillospiraceae bacterium]
MYVGQIITADSANGTGMRVSLFVSGCTNHCKGCFQPETWDFAYGRPYTPDMEDRLMKELAKSYYDGLTILGGEPFELSNQRELVKLIRRLRKELPDRNIWMYTGFTYDKDLVPGGCRYIECTDEILDSIDMLVDGRFIEELKNITLTFRGSENQRIIDMKQTREQGKVVLSPLMQKKHR